MDLPALTYPHADVPASGTLREMAPGVHWLRMPLPFALDHINLWAIEEDDGIALIDTGYGAPAVQALWEQALAGFLRGRSVTRIVVTHFHPDHMGLAGWLSDRWDVIPDMTLAEWLSANVAFAGGFAGEDPRRRAFYRWHGVPEAVIDQIAGRGNTYRQGVPHLPVFHRRLRDGDRLSMGGQEWRVIVGTGHSPEHACLHCADLKVLISGDQVLPRITPNIGVWPNEPEADPLALYLGSIPRFRGLAPDTLVLPSHNLPFTGLERRLDQMEHHHEERIRRILDHCAEPRSAYEMLPHLFRRALDIHHIGLALGEAVAHLRYMENRGQLRREDAGGIRRYRRA